MRSRYSAFALNDPGYLRFTWDPDTCPAVIRLGRSQWLGLTVFGSTGGGTFDQEGTVDFHARYEDADGKGSVTETSRFRRFEGRWVYVGPA